MRKVEPSLHAMSEMRTWSHGPLDPLVRTSIERLARLEDVRQMAIMPDAHVAGRVCVGAVIATSRLIYPEAIGGDIGCGYSGVALDAPADALRDPGVAPRVFERLRALAPYLRHRSLSSSPGVSDDIRRSVAGRPRVMATLERDGRIELGTLGRGNHFLEFQSDEEGRLWVLVHSGSRAFGQAISREHTPTSRGTRRIEPVDSATDAGAELLADHAAARAFARENRRLLVDAACAAASAALRAPPIDGTRFDTDHNHVVREQHGDIPLWIHRKGANLAEKGYFNVIPGSMGSRSFHVRGRGVAESLLSSSHGAGRSLTRSEAARRISPRALNVQLGEVLVEPALRGRLLEEAPSAYKDIDAVMRAQRDLVKIERRLRSILVYRAG